MPRRKGQSRKGTTRRASGSITRSNNARIRHLVGSEMVKLNPPKVADTAANPSKELDPKAQKNFKNPFGVIGRARRGEAS